MDLLSYKSGRLGALCLALFAPAAGCQPVTEYQVKAAFLFNFTKFVEWPASPPSNPFCIAIIGDDPFGGAIEEAVKGRTVDGRRIEVRHIKAGIAPPSCEIAFFTVPVREVKSTLASYQGTATLTVGEIPGFCRFGGMIGLQLVDNKVRLEINPEAAQRAHLQLSSKLLALASLVRDTRP